MANKKFRWLGLFLALVMVLGLVACRSFESGKTTTEPMYSGISTFPLLFLYATEENSETFLLGYVEDGVIRENDAFSYNGRPLMDFLKEEETAVTSDILPAGTALTFVSSTGAKFAATSRSMLTESDMLNVLVHLLPQLDATPQEAGYYLGATQGVSLQPKGMTRQDQDFTADLNSDGQPDTVTWEFSEVTEDGKTFYYYHITATVGGKRYTISADEAYYPCSQDGFAVFPLDIEGDGIWELAILEKIYGIFREFAIYSLQGSEAEPIFHHTIDGMP